MAGTPPTAGRPGKVPSRTVAEKCALFTELLLLESHERPRPRQAPLNAHELPTSDTATPK